MGFLSKKKLDTTGTMSKTDLSEAPGDSPITNKDPPPVYSTADSSSPTPTDTPTDTIASRTDTQDTTLSTVYSPDEFKGAIRQPTVSGERIVVARHQTPPVNDGGLPEVVVPGATDGNTAPSITSESHHSGLILHSDSLVTPLHLLGDQSDMVDCPFCRRRVETRVQKDPSAATHASAAGLFLVSVGGVVLPYRRQWKHHISHFCTNCSRKVAVQRNGEKTMQPLGTPEHLRQASRFPLAASQQELRQTTS